MPRPPRIQFENALYHVTSRGNGRQLLFHADADRRRFLKQLQDNLSTYQVTLYAWVLMSNHFHLVVRTPRANLSRFMQRLNSSYSLYYRFKYNKPGHLLGGRFKALLIQDDSYLLTVTRYIHANPLQTSEMKNRAAKDRINHLESYPWSSYPAYVNASPFPDWMNPQVLLAYGSNRKQARRRYQAYMHADIQKSDEPILALMKASPYAIGTPQFAEQTARDLAKRKTGGPRDADESLPRIHIPLTAIDQTVAHHYGQTPQDLRMHGHHAGLPKAIAMELAARWSGLSLREIGQHYGKISGQAVAVARQRLQRAKPIDWDALENKIQSCPKSPK